MPEDIDIKAVLADPCVHFWVKNALRAGLGEDPVDFAQDAGLVAAIARQQCARTFGKVRS